MSVLEKEATPVRLRRSQPTARPGRNGRGTAPRLRPAALPAPTIASSGQTIPARACRPAPLDRRAASATTASPVSWRLTERGIAVVLVLLAMVAVAALAVVVPTAARVTGDNYRPAGASQLTRP